MLMEYEEGKHNDGYSCNTASETLIWINAITHFLRPYSFFLLPNVVDFLKDRLWEALDKDWIQCLQTARVEHLLLIPSGLVQDHWPDSLKHFVLTARSLAFPRQQVHLQTVFPGLNIIPLNNVLSQGMNPKKKHEVEILSSLVSYTSTNVGGAHRVVDVGAGLGYLSQVLAFQYQLPVVAIDASCHHGTITNTRAERIKKHYMAKLHKSGLEKGLPNMPKTITSRILSSSMLRELSNYCCHHDDLDEKHLKEKCFDNSCDVRPEAGNPPSSSSAADADRGTPLVLAGLHACGDLSVTMLRAMAECEAVKAVISIGCCYNLLSEDGCESGCSDTGFPVSKGVQSMGISLGKNSRDLACQSAERWRDLEKDAGVQNFDLHAFRAAFQLVLQRYYPEALMRNSSIGRQGKALRRRYRNGSMSSSKLAECKVSQKILETDSSLAGSQWNCADQKERLVDNYSLFEKYSLSGLDYLGLEPLEDIDLHGLWTECQPFAGLIGPYWSLRAALGPLLETLIQLDRLLFLQEQDTSLEVRMLPIFDPVLSPRNLAIIARKK
ncbi:hypothetical protein vseg_007622 [Gypsophila vaccaria]